MHHGLGAEEEADGPGEREPSLACTGIFHIAHLVGVVRPGLALSSALSNCAGLCRSQLPHQQLRGEE